MKRAQNRNALKSILKLGLAMVLTLNVGAFTGQRQPSGEPRLSSITNGGNERRRISIESQIALAEQPARRAPNKAWLLQPEVLDYLSAGGKHAALSLNGLARNGPAPGSPSRQSSFVMQTTPGDNIRVNDPSICLARQMEGSRSPRRSISRQTWARRRSLAAPRISTETLLQRGSMIHRRTLIFSTSRSPDSRRRPPISRSCLIRTRSRCGGAQASS